MVTLRPPYPTPEERDQARRERHARWIASLSERDWARIRDLAAQLTPNFGPARLDDLDAPGIAVGVCHAGDEGRFSGERIGVVRHGEVAVLVWEGGARNKKAPRP